MKLAHIQKVKKVVVFVSTLFEEISSSTHINDIVRYLVVTSFSMVVQFYWPTKCSVRMQMNELRKLRNLFMLGQVPIYAWQM